MNKVAQYLQEHLVGEVTTSADARQHFSTDGSIFRLTPQIIVYPRTESDVRKTARFSWQLAGRGRVIPVTARGLGTNQSGAALGSGIMLVFPAHLNKILILDSKKGVVIVQPGLNYGKLQQTLQTHGVFLPPYPASVEYSTIGGAIANNSGGEKSVKYGVTKDYVKELRFVLANGEVIVSSRLSKRELNHKKGLSTFEGEVYRALDGLLIDYKELLNKTKPALRKNASGYDLWNIKDKKGNFDLTPLLVGSQGTLGIVTEAKLTAVNYNPVVSMLVGYFDDINKTHTAITNLRQLKPSALELVDENLLNFVDANNPNQLKGLASKPFAKISLIIEFDDIAAHTRQAKVKKAKKILTQLATDYKISKDEQEQASLWKLRHSAGAVSWHDDDKKRALPIIDDVVVPLPKIPEFFEKVYSMFDKIGLKCPIWGHAGDGNFHIQPFFDLGELGDRQKVYKLMDHFYAMVLGLGGSISGQYNDGRLRAPFVKLQYGDEVYALFEKVKAIFDPFNILNPGVKIGVGFQDVQPLLRHEYSLGHLYNHMPRT
jgi:FAD/FMN-containing dehydrogenase